MDDKTFKSIADTSINAARSVGDAQGAILAALIYLRGGEPEKALVVLEEQDSKWRERLGLSPLDG